MKKGIHPQWHPQAKVTCACGHSLTVGSTQPELQVEVCSHCHPFYTGEMRYIDTMGRVERFMAKRKTAAVRREKVKTKSRQKKQEERPETLREMLGK